MRLLVLVAAAVLLAPLILVLAALWPALEPLVHARARALAHTGVPDTAALQGARA